MSLNIERAAKDMKGAVHYLAHARGGHVRRRRRGRLLHGRRPRAVARHPRAHRGRRGGAVLRRDPVGGRAARLLAARGRRCRATTRRSTTSPGRPRSPRSRPRSPSTARRTSSSSTRAPSTRSRTTTVPRCTRRRATELAWERTLAFLREHVVVRRAPRAARARRTLRRCVRAHPRPPGASRRVATFSCSGGARCAGPCRPEQWRRATLGMCRRRCPPVGTCGARPRRSPGEQATGGFTFYAPDGAPGSGPALAVGSLPARRVRGAARRVAARGERSGRGTPRPQRRLHLGHLARPRRRRRARGRGAWASTTTP